jgi:hypothetical protein
MSVSGMVPASIGDTVATLYSHANLVRDSLFPKQGDIVRQILGQVREELVQIQSISCRLEQELVQIGPEAQMVRLMLAQLLTWRQQVQLPMQLISQQFPLLHTLLTSTPMGQQLASLSLEKLFSTCTSLQDVNGVLIPLLENMTLFLKQLKQVPMYAQIEPIVQQMLPAITASLHGQPLVQFKPILQGFSMTVQQWCPAVYPNLRAALCGFEMTVRENPILRIVFGY